MKNLLWLFLVLSLHVCVGRADDWGCQCLLCLSDSRGPTTESECEPPITKLYNTLKKGGDFPTCDLAGDAASGSGSYAVQTAYRYDPCPDGMETLTGWVAESTSTERSDWLTADAQYSADGSSDDIGPQACVGNILGSYIENAWDEDEESRLVQIVDAIEWMSPQSPRSIDIYIDGELSHRVHW